MSITPKKQPPPKPINLFSEGKILPQAPELEDFILSTLLSHNTKETRQITRFLNVEDFYKPIAQTLFNHIKSLSFRNIPVDVYILIDELEKANELESIGGPFVVHSLLIKQGNLFHFQHHALIIKQKSLQRQIITLTSKYLNESLNNTMDVFDIIDKLQLDLREITKGLNNDDKLINTSSVCENMLKDINSVEENVKFVWQTGHKKFDDIVGITPNKILLIAAAAKAGKSKFTSSIMFRLLEMHNDISIYWVTLEDSAKDILAAYLASKILMKPKNILRRKFNEKSKVIMEQHIEQFKSFDIEFQEQSAKIRNVSIEFENFCKVRKDRLNILIIDNVLSLSDKEDFKSNENSMYDFIMYEILRCRQTTKGLIIPIHHYKDAQQHESKLEKGYRPVLSDMKGTEAFRRTPNQVLLLNNPSKYKDLMDEYRERDEVLKHIFICDTGANRDDVSDDESALIHFYHSLDYTIFEEI